MHGLVNSIMGVYQECVFLVHKQVKIREHPAQECDLPLLQ